MEKLVKQILGRSETVKSWPRPKNWLIKLLSLLFAVFLWYFVVGEDKVDMNVFIPIEIVNLPRNLVVSNQFKKQLEVTVSGPRGLIRGLSMQNISRSVDLSKASPGTVVIHNKPDSIHFPRGIRVLRIQPTHIILLLDRLIQKDLIIKPAINGPPPEGYSLTGVQLDPEKITVTGPSAVLREEGFLTTDAIDITSLKQPATTQVALKIKPAIADLIGEPVVSAHINIQEKNETRSVPGIPVKIDPPGAGRKYEYSPQRIEIKAEIPYGIISKTDDLANLFKVTVPVNGLKPGTHDLKIKVDAPGPVKILKVTPDTVNLRIEETKIN